jgi:hypothetical protein
VLSWDASFKSIARKSSRVVEGRLHRTLADALGLRQLRRGPRIVAEIGPL